MWYVSGAGTVAMAKPIKVFLSYSREDEEFARKLAADLRADGYFEPWLDVENIKALDPWETKIREAIESSELLLILLSSNSVTSPSFIREAELTLSRGGMERVIGLIIDGIAKYSIPRILRQVDILDLSDPDRYAAGLNDLANLARTLRSIMSIPQHVPESLKVGLAPSSPRIADIVDVDDFVAKVVEKLRYQIPTRNAEALGYSNSGAGPLSNLVFVVISFEEDMDPIFEGIKAAAEAVGLDAKRVKDVVGDYKIDTKLIDMIHKSRMVVVDRRRHPPDNLEEGCTAVYAIKRAGHEPDRSMPGAGCARHSDLLRQAIAGKPSRIHVDVLARHFSQHESTDVNAVEDWADEGVIDRRPHSGEPGPLAAHHCREWPAPGRRDQRESIDRARAMGRLIERIGRGMACRNDPMRRRDDLA
jgi:hypothetical protein